MAGGHREHVDRYLDVYNRAADDELDELVTPGYVHHSNAAELTVAGFKRGAGWMRAAMPDFVIELADFLDAGDRVAVRWIGRGTHRGSMFGEQPTGRTIVLYGTTIFRFEGDRIAEDWEAMDEADLRRQAGALAD